MNSFLKIALATLSLLVPFSLQAQDYIGTRPPDNFGTPTYPDKLYTTGCVKVPADGSVFSACNDATKVTLGSDVALSASSVTLSNLDANAVVITRGGGLLDTVSTFSYVGGNVGLGTLTPCTTCAIDMQTGSRGFNIRSTASNGIYYTNPSGVAGALVQTMADSRAQAIFQSAASGSPNGYICQNSSSVGACQTNALANSFNIFANTNNALHLGANGAVGTTLEGGGDFGIGGTNPTTKLSVYGVITSSSAIPSVACDAGTGVLSAASTNMHGTITTGAGSTNCTVTFSASWPKTPVCIVSEGSTLALVRVSAVSTAEFTAAATALNGDVIYYHCMGAP